MKGQPNDMLDFAKDISDVFLRNRVENILWSNENVGILK